MIHSPQYGAEHGLGAPRVEVHLVVRFCGSSGGDFITFDIVRTALFLGMYLLIDYCFILPRR